MLGHLKSPEQIQSLEVFSHLEFWWWWWRWWIAREQVCPKSPIGVQLVWELQSLVNDLLHFHTHQTLQWALVLYIEAFAFIMYFHSFIQVFPLTLVCMCEWVCASVATQSHGDNSDYKYECTQNAMRRCQDLIIQASFWRGMHGTTCEEQPHLCRICTARQSSQTQKQKSLPEASFHLVSCFFHSLSLLFVTTYFSFQRFLLVFECFFWEDSLNQYTNFLP